MTQKRRALCILTVLAMAIVPVACAWNFVRSAASESEIAASDAQDDGIIRVYLKSLGDPAALQITLAGEYVIGSTGAFRFSRDTAVVVTAEDGHALVTVGGLTIDMGSSFTFTRCQAEDGAENGIYIYESERGALYEGDLQITCDAGTLMPVLSIGIEDYLCGVIAYEMSDSFPIEALKAQAVAARTYAMSRKAARTGSAYDVTDTTSDQVYKGLVADYTNVIAAVEATSGVVGTYKGAYATCYYTASNGGQIATPNQIWGGDGDYGYIQMKEDPYDVENPKSMVNAYTVSLSYDAASKLYQMLDAKADKSGHDEVRIDSIASIAFANPKFEGSLMCRDMNVTIVLSARDKGWVPVDFTGEQLLGWAMGYAWLDGAWFQRGVTDWAALPETQTIAFSVYDEIKDGLALGLNNSDYEIPRVEKTDAGYTIEFRRFGHGVGMSQRGAQWMAGKYDKGYQEILSFYYPGMALARIAWNSPVLPAPSALPASIAAEQLLIPPTEAALPALKTGEFYASVTLDSGKSRLNVRVEPSTDAKIVVKLDDGYRIIVSSETADGWAQVRTANFAGYVKAEFIRAD